MGFGTGGNGGTSVKINSSFNIKIQNTVISAGYGGDGTAAGGIGGKGMNISQSQNIEFHTGSILGGVGGIGSGPFDNISAGGGGDAIIAINSKDIFISDASINGGNTSSKIAYHRGDGGEGIYISGVKNITIINNTIKGGNGNGGQGGNGLTVLNQSIGEIHHTSLSGGNSGGAPAYIDSNSIITNLIIPNFYTN